MNVRLEAVAKVYDGRPVLAGVNLQLDAGQCLLVCGPNGSGKTTLLRLLATLIPPSAGRVLFDGRPAADWGPALRGRIGVLLHESMVYDELTAEENLTWTARLYGMVHPGPAVRDALAKVGLLAVAAEPVGRFSRGMKQRLSLARSLLHDPDLVLWDEPYAGLDRRGWERLEETLGELRARRATVVVVAHRWEPLWPFADRMVYMRAGRIRCEGARGTVDAEGWRRLVEEDGQPMGNGGP